MSGVQPRVPSLDPRHFQIAAQSFLLVLGLTALDFDIGLLQIAVTFAAVLAAQFVGTKLARLEVLEWRGAISTALSLCLLLRASSLAWVFAAGAISIASKFLLRIGDRHIFNPSCFGIVFALALSDQVWVTPGQWGDLALFVLCAGWIVSSAIQRSPRRDITAAFLAFHAAMLFGRAWWLGDPLSIPVHQLDSGVLLLFSFSMLPDPKTIPGSRAGRILFAFLVACGAYFVRFELYRTNGLLWALTFASLAFSLGGMMKNSVFVPAVAGALAAMIALPQPSYAMCGCMVAVKPKKPLPQELLAKQLLNKTSKVALVREGDQTILTISNDVLTELDEFGLVVPVPAVITQKDVRIVEGSVFTALENITNPRLVEMWDPDPCPAEDMIGIAAEGAAPPSAAAGGGPKEARGAADYGVKVEAHYDVGEYSIAVLSAKEGRGAGLMEWLNKFHYEVPQTAVPVLDSYIKQGLKFFVAKVNYKKMRGRGGATGVANFLRPIQVRYETPRFMLPVRLGTINADGPQELVAYAVSPRGKIEATNYRTLRLPSGLDLPLYVKDQFEKVYAGIFDAQTKKEDMRVIFQEFVGRGMMDHSTAEKVGLFWDKKNVAAQNYTLTRLHFRYDRDHFPEDLVLQDTSDNEYFTVNFKIHHPATNTSCEQGQAYLKTLGDRRNAEAQALASLTSWELGEIREKMGLPRNPAPPPAQRDPPAKPDDKKEGFWQKLWR